MEYDMAKEYFEISRAVT